MVDGGHLQLQPAGTLDAEAVQHVQLAGRPVRVRLEPAPVDGELELLLRQPDRQLELLVDDEGEAAGPFLLPEAVEETTENHRIVLLPVGPMRGDSLERVGRVRIPHDHVVRIEAGIEVQCLPLAAILVELQDEAAARIAVRDGGQDDDVACSLVLFLETSFIFFFAGATQVLK